MTIRVTGGTLRGRKLRSPRDDRTRPTAARVRESVFSMLGQRMDGLRALDLFAGAGTLGIEAASRGADSVVFVESDRSQARLLGQNLELLDGLTDTKLLTMGASPAIDLLQREGRRFDLVFLDPPYGAGLAAELVAKLARGGDAILADSATLVAETSVTEFLPEKLGDGWAASRRREYGQTAITLFCREAR